MKKIVSYVGMFSLALFLCVCEERFSASMPVYAAQISIEEPSSKQEQLLDWTTLLDFPVPVPEEENPEERMAHNIYSDPDLWDYSDCYSGFLIDFRADYDAVCTYWALCNWEMDTSDLESRSMEVSDTGGAYAGLQNAADGRKAIMSFWEISYINESGESEILRASQVYPAIEKTNTFDGEGEGTNLITEYIWEGGKWYRMYLNCYDDTVTGHTFVEQWFQDIESGEWTKISCFDTNLSHSFFKGSMSQFMENYDSDESNAVRSCAFRNLYVRDYATGEWLPVTASVMSIDTWWDNKKGSFAFTADDCTLYGITCGYGDDVASLNEDISEYYPLAPTEEAQTPPDQP